MNIVVQNVFYVLNNFHRQVLWRLFDWSRAMVKREAFLARSYGDYLPKVAVNVSRASMTQPAIIVKYYSRYPYDENQPYSFLLRLSCFLKARN
jgi:hypothetical protein